MNTVRPSTRTTSILEERIAKLSAPLPLNGRPANVPPLVATRFIWRLCDLALMHDTDMLMHQGPTQWGLPYPKVVFKCRLHLRISHGFGERLRYTVLYATTPGNRASYALSTMPSTSRPSFSLRLDPTTHHSTRETAFT